MVSIAARFPVMLTNRLRAISAQASMIGAEGIRAGRTPITAFAAAPATERMPPGDADIITNFITTDIAVKEVSSINPCVVMNAVDRKIAVTSGEVHCIIGHGPPKTQNGE